MTDLPSFEGARVHSVEFGVAHFQLRLSNESDEFSVTSTADISFESQEQQAADFRDSKAASGLVELIGAGLDAITVDEPNRSGKMVFDTGQIVRAWWPDKTYDFLFDVRQINTGECWIIE